MENKKLKDIEFKINHLVKDFSKIKFKNLLSIFFQELFLKFKIKFIFLIFILAH